MNETTNIPVAASGVRWLWIAAAVIVLDQLSKLWIQGSMALYESIEVLPVLNIYHTFNPGAAWSFLAHADGWQRWLFSALAIGVSAGLIVWLRRLALAQHALLITGLTLIVGGAIGNLIDRLYLGHVVDFILVHWENSYFPAFNVADSAISVGATLVIFDSLRDAVRERRARAAGTDS
ncbi:MAG TPA: signal peptidase II [Steroidobacteraceae bacterium]|jgi:signal peptidase II|nr:signal peptidase II [Steroidobacteraceae bacterium]